MYVLIEREARKLVSFVRRLLLIKLIRFVRTYRFNSLAQLRTNINGC